MLCFICLYQLLGFYDGSFFQVPVILYGGTWRLSGYLWSWDNKMSSLKLCRIDIEVHLSFWAHWRQAVSGKVIWNTRFRDEFDLEKKDRKFMECVEKAEFKAGEWKDKDINITDINYELYKSL